MRLQGDRERLTKYRLNSEEVLRCSFAFSIGPANCCASFEMPCSSQCCMNAERCCFSLGCVVTSGRGCAISAAAFWRSSWSIWSCAPAEFGFCFRIRSSPKPGEDGRGSLQAEPSSVQEGVEGGRDLPGRLQGRGKVTVCHGTAQAEHQETSEPCLNTVACTCILVENRGSRQWERALCRAQAVQFCSSCLANARRMQQSAFVSILKKDAQVLHCSSFREKPALPSMQRISRSFISIPHQHAAAEGL